MRLQAQMYRQPNTSQQTSDPPSCQPTSNVHVLMKRCELEDVHSQGVPKVSQEKYLSLSWQVSAYWKMQRPAKRRKNAIPDSAGLDWAVSEGKHGLSVIYVFVLHLIQGRR